MLCNLFKLTCYCRLEQLTEHRKRHTGERSYLCSKCGKGYFKQPHLDKHMLTHLKDHLEKPVKLILILLKFCSQKIFFIYIFTYL